jgi:hypothetical protein
VIDELGFSRRGARIEAALRRAIAASRLHPSEPAPKTDSVIVRVLRGLVYSPVGRQKKQELAASRSIDEPTDHEETSPEIALAPSDPLPQPETPIEERLRRMSIKELSEYSKKLINYRTFPTRPRPSYPAEVRPPQNSPRKYGPGATRFAAVESPTPRYRQAAPAPR